jgi:hypothetical protein
MNTSQVEIKEYLDFINMMIPGENNQVQHQQNHNRSRNMNDSKNTLTLMSGNFDNEDMSLLTVPSEMSSLLNMNSMIHSRILKPDKGGGLQVVAEQDKELSGLMLDGLDNTEDEKSSDS